MKYRSPILIVLGFLSLLVYSNWRISSVQREADIAQSNYLAQKDTTRLVYASKSRDSLVYARQVQQLNITYKDALAKAIKKEKAKEVSRTSIAVISAPQVDTQTTTTLSRQDTVYAKLELTDTTKIHGIVEAAIVAHEGTAVWRTDLRSPTVRATVAIGCGARGATVAATAGSQEVEILPSAVAPQVCKKPSLMSKIRHGTVGAIVATLIILAL